MRNARTYLVAILAASLTIAGCGGGDDDDEKRPKTVTAPVPEGFALKRGPDYAFSYPSSWEVQAERREPRGAIQSVLGPAGAGGLPPQIAVGRTPDDKGSFDMALRTWKADNQARRARFKILSERPVRLDGAADARLIEAQYLQATPEKTTETVRTIDLLVRTESGTQLDLLVRAPASDFEGTRLRDVVESFRVA
jgi:hypothetical protein